MQVRELLHKRIRDTFLHPQFNTDVMKPLSIEMLLDQEVRAAPGPGVPWALPEGVIMLLNRHDAKTAPHGLTRCRG